MSLRPELRALSADLGAHLVRVEKEVGEIERLAGTTVPDRTALWAIGAHLQPFCSGCEAVLGRAVERFDGLPPHGSDSHVRLLQAATLDVPGIRPPVLSSETAKALDPYRAFRHFFRHGYGIDLEWPRMEEKVRGIRAVHGALLRDVQVFRDFLDAAAGA